MAIGLGSRVRVKLTSLAFSGANGLLQPQPPLFGRVTAFAGSVADVLTEQGDAVQADAAFLDEITPASAIQLQGFLDKIVVGLSSPPAPPLPEARFGAAYVGRVTSMYAVNGEPRALIKTLTDDMYYERPTALVHVLRDR